MDPAVFPGDVDADGVLHLDLPRKAVQAACRAKFAGRRVDVEIRERKSKRSFDQNKWMHAALTTWVRETLHDYCSPSVADGVERLKDELLALCFGYHVYQSPLTGEIVRGLMKPHTSGLTTKEFTELMDVAIVEAAKTGHIIALPDEWRERKAKRRKAA